MTKQLHILNALVEKFNVLLLSLIVFFIPIYHKYLSPLIGLWAISSIVLIVLKRQKITKNNSLFALISFYLLLIIGLLWTDNQKAGGFDLEVKMSLIIFPLLLLFLNYTKNQIKQVVFSFVLGIVFSASYLFYYAYLNYETNNAIDSFFYVNLSTIIHPSYLSFYVVTAIMLILVDLKYKVIKLFKSEIISLIVLLFLFVFNLFLLSKIGIVTGLLVILFFTFSWVLTQKKHIIGLGILIVMAFSFYTAYQKSPYVKQRADELIDGLTSVKENETNSSTGIRLQIWRQGLTLIKEQPIFGYGTGDVKDVLMSKYKQNGIDAAYNKKLNAHNQFIQIGIGLGVLGLLLFVSVFYFGFSDGLKNKNYYIIGFILVSILFMFPESVLENQAGTIFFGLFISLLNQKSLAKKFEI